MSKKIFTIYCYLLIICGVQAESLERPIVIVIPSYNNIDWYRNNLDLVLRQDYTNYRVIYINDCSSDKTGEHVEETVKQFTDDYQVISFDAVYDEHISVSTKAFGDLINKEKHFFTLVNNKYRRGCLLANLYPAVCSSQDEEIIVTVDGDDWLPHTNVLKEVNVFYASGDVWLTHGRFIEYPGNGSNWSLKIPEEVIKQNGFRQYRLPSHLRTFYSWLFKKIQLKDLLYNGKFFPMTGDMAMMFPMIEMAGERHAYSESINYVYNMANPINDNK
ncbi:MAG: glycosyltransferase family A protein, partial [Chlamydiota bacterium]